MIRIHNHPTSCAWCFQSLHCCRQIVKHTCTLCKCLKNTRAHISSDPLSTHDLIDREYDDDEQETSTTKTEVFAFASRTKAKAKSRRPSTACSSSRTVPILERLWIDIEPGAQFDQAYPVAKKNKHSSSTRRTTSRRRWGDRILDTERFSSEQL